MKSCVFNPRVNKKNGIAKPSYKALNFRVKSAKKTHITLRKIPANKKFI
jgi:hypothetical protein